MIFYQLPFWNNIYLKDIILWLIIPVITILILMNVVAESEEKYRRVHKLIDIVLACIGWYMLWGAVNVGLKEYKELNFVITKIRRFKGNIDGE